MLTQENLKEIINYNPDTGVFTWSKNRGGLIKIGAIAGTNKTDRRGKAYQHIQINKKIYRAHRLAWLYMNGEWPNQIDHADGNGLNNIFKNLSNVTHRVNHRNTRLRSTNKSGFCGVIFQKRDKNWRAQIKIDGIMIHLGCFKEIDDAIDARKKANKEYNFHENHGKQRPK